MILLTLSTNFLNFTLLMLLLRITSRVASRCSIERKSNLVALVLESYSSNMSLLTSEERAAHTQQNISLAKHLISFAPEKRFLYSRTKNNRRHGWAQSLRLAHRKTGRLMSFGMSIVLLSVFLLGWIRCGWGLRTLQKR